MDMTLTDNILNLKAKYESEVLEVLMFKTNLFKDTVLSLLDQNLTTFGFYVLFYYLNIFPQMQLRIISRFK